MRVKVPRFTRLNGCPSGMVIGFIGAALLFGLPLPFCFAPMLRSPRSLQVVFWLRPPRGGTGAL